jgi:hypothetical protein
MRVRFTPSELHHHTVVRRPAEIFKKISGFAAVKWQACRAHRE